MLSIVPPLRAQEVVEPWVNLFGDEIVTKEHLEGAPLRRGDTTGQGNSPSSKRVPSGYEHTLIFQDGRGILGELVAVTKQEVAWRLPGADETLRFGLNEISRIELHAGPADDIHPPAGPATLQSPEKQDARPLRATVELARGGWLCGNLTSPDGQNFVLKMNDRASFFLSRPEVSWMYFGLHLSQGFGFYGHVGDTFGWRSIEYPGQPISANSAWEMENGFASLKLPLTPRFKISFAVPREGEGIFHASIQLPNGGRANVNLPALDLALGPKKIRCSALDTTGDYGQLHIQIKPVPSAGADTSLNGPVKYEICYDDEEKRLLVLRDGLAFDFALPASVIPKRIQNREQPLQKLSFFSQAVSTLLRINRLQVLPWDGLVPNRTVEMHPGLDRLFFEDGRLLAGQLESVAENELIFSGSAKPLQNGLAVELPNELLPDASPVAMLVLGEQGKLPVTEIEAIDGRIHGRSSLQEPIDIPIVTGQSIAFPHNSSPDAVPPLDTLVFQDAEELSGSLLSAGSAEPLRWRTNRGPETSIDSSRITGIRLHATEPFPERDTATIEFRNGDRLRGEVVAFDGKSIRFKESLLGTESFPVDQVWKLYPSSHAALLDGSVRSLEWLVNTNGTGRVVNPAAESWSYLDGNFFHRWGTPPAEIVPPQPALEAPLKAFPGRFELSFHVNQPDAEYLRFAVGIGAGWQRVEIDEIGTQLEIQGFGAEVAHGQKQRTTLLRKKLPEATSPASCRLFVDSSRGTLDIYQNGKAVAQFRKQGRGFVGAEFGHVDISDYPEPGHVPVFSDIRIAPWSGELPTGAGNTPTVMLANGDAFHGRLLAARDRMLLIDSAAGPLELDIEKVLAIEFGGIPVAERPVARVLLRDGSTLQLDRCHIDGHELTGHSASLGEFKIPREAVSELILHPATPRFPCALEQTAQEQNRSESGAPVVEAKTK